EQEIPMIDDAGATEATVEPNLVQEMISIGPTIRKRRRQGDAGEEGPKAPAKVLRKDHDVAHAEHSARGGKSLTGMNAVNLISSFCGCKSSKEKLIAEDQDSERSTPSPPITGSLGRIYKPGWGMPNSCRLDTPEAYQDVVDHIAPLGYFSELCHLPNDEFLSQYNMNLARQVAMGSQLRLRFEQEAKLLKKSVAQVARRDQRIATREKHIKDIRATSSSDGGKSIMAAFEEFKKHEDERVSAQCAEIDALLDALSVDFDEELYPHMLTAIAGRRWGMSEGLKYGVDHEKAGLELIAVEAFDPEADNKYVAALHNLKDLSYPYRRVGVIEGCASGRHHGILIFRKRY
ncbi:hypothetical protein Tco_1542283, partial [Tanacetum coccineum]